MELGEEDRMSITEIVLAWYSAVATALVLGLALWARIDRRTIHNLYDRVDQQAEELAVWREEATEIEDESDDARFDDAIQKLCAAGRERLAERIVEALGPFWGDEDFTLGQAQAIVLGELQNAWQPERADREVA
jgi:hypothetical protein